MSRAGARPSYQHQDGVRMQREAARQSHAAVRDPGHLGMGAAGGRRLAGSSLSGSGARVAALAAGAILCGLPGSWGRAVPLRWPRTWGTAAPSCLVEVGDGDVLAADSCQARQPGWALGSGGPAGFKVPPSSSAGSGDCRPLCPSHGVPDRLGPSGCPCIPASPWGRGVFCRSGGGRSYGPPGAGPRASCLWGSFSGLWEAGAPPPPALAPPSVWAVKLAAQALS